MVQFWDAFYIASYEQYNAILVWCWAHVWRKFIDAQKIQGKGKTGKAITYSLNQWPKLQLYTKSSYLSIYNNRAERAVKPFVIERKNWLFSNTATCAMMYSLVETAKANGLIRLITSNIYWNNCRLNLKTLAIYCRGIWR